jgi:DNA-binding response OmpR family regulator
LKQSIARVLLVDDFEPFRRIASLILEDIPSLQLIEASDGMQAVEMARDLQPDLILLDIGLPKLNGLEAARSIRDVSPNSKIIFLSQNSSADIVQQAFCLGAWGYIVKVNAGSELLPAVEAVLRGEKFAGGMSFAGGNDPGLGIPFAYPRRSSPALTSLIHPRHEAVFYADEQAFLNDLTQFVGKALKSGNAAVVLATESHRESLLAKLQTYGVDIATAVEEGSYVALDAGEAVSSCMVRGMLDADRFVSTIGGMVDAARAAKQGNGSVAIFGECAQLLWAQGEIDTAIELETLAKRLPKAHDIDIRCGYFLGSFQGMTESRSFQRICAEHSAVHLK